MRGAGLAEDDEVLTAFALGEEIEDGEYCKSGIGDISLSDGT